jgi:hypothetical protein
MPEPTASSTPQPSWAPTIIATTPAGTLTPIAIPVGKPENYLIYRLLRGSSGLPPLYLYLIDEDRHIPILPDWDVSCLVLSSQHQIAFASRSHGSLAVYNLDYPFVGNEPTLITNEPGFVGCPRSWSPDGRILAISSSERRDLVLWDGRELATIFETQADYSWTRWGDAFVWSSNNRLAFISKTLDDDHSEVFYWDGVFTSNLSQNPAGTDWFPTWSSRGQLAYQTSTEDGSTEIFVWDGVSTRFGAPDRSTFLKITPGLTGSGSYPIWNLQGQLTFTGRGSRIYFWDGQLISFLDVDTDFQFGFYSWNTVGQLAINSPYNGVLVLDPDNAIIFSAETRYPSPAWTDSDQLVYCQGGQGWSLRIWDDGDVIEVLPPDGSYIYAHLPNGKEVVCSSG